MRAAAIIVTACFASCASAAPLRPQTINLIANGSFETGDFTAWQLNAQDTLVTHQIYDGYSPEAGADYALLGPRYENGTLSQSFVDMPGESLTLTFWLASDGQTYNDFTAIFNGQTLLTLTGIAEQGWTRYSETLIATGNDTLQLGFRDDPQYLALDNVSVTPNPVSEPGAATLLLAGLGIAAVVRKARGNAPKHRYGQF
jgi:hypothetical protein